MEDKHLKHTKKLGILFCISFFVSFALWHTLGESSEITIFSIIIPMISGVFLLFFSIPLIFEYFGEIIGKIFAKITRLDNDGFKKNKPYYREILKENSPLILGYIDNFEVEDKDLIAELLYLENNQIVKFINGSLEINDTKNFLELKTCEKEFLKIIMKFGFEKKDNWIINYLKEFVSQDAKALSLINIREKKEKSKFISKIMWVLFFIVSFFIGYAICVLLSEGMESIVTFELSDLLKFEISDLPILLFFCWPAGMFLLVFCVGSFLSGYDRFMVKKYKRTFKGRELNLKLEGLKNYLKDYSMLSEREAKEIELWEDYLIYSVIFGHNKKIIEEYEPKIYNR